ncbi:sensor histidine kinase [Aquibium carbonis]|nr:sensor histidine kinase [Aquibium carbonis]
MSFTFAARTLLELGKELISSDEVALYELIKNSVDAGSPTVRIVARIVLDKSGLQRAMDTIAGIGRDPKLPPATPSEVLDVIRGAKPENSAHEHFDAFMAQFENAQDLVALRDQLHEAYSQHNWLEVHDSGSGMSLDDLSEIFLRIGTRSRRADNVSGAQYLGDKGVGRLSAMRLGERLRVTTTKSGEPSWHELDIDWRQFSHDREMDISDVVVEPADGELKSDSRLQGTTIRISDLTGHWGLDRFRELLQGKIARMIDPFEAGAANRLLEVHHNNTRVLVPSVPQSLLKAAHASAHGELKFEDGEPVLAGTVAYHRYGQTRILNQRGAEIYSITQQGVKRRGKKGHAAFQNVAIRPDALAGLGPFKFDIYWFNRRIVEPVPSLTGTASETREQVAQWSGGPMLYRYGFRVLPYGEPQDDWLNLDVVAFGESGFKLNRQQVIGRVRVWSPHTALSEQTNRQGLVDSDAASALRTIMMWVLHVELRNLINEVDKSEQVSKRQAEEKTLAFRETQHEVEQAVSELRAKLGVSARPLVDRVTRGVNTLAEQCAALIGRVDAAVKELTEEREKFVYLAGIGLMTEFIFHELDRSVGHTLRLLHDTRRDDSAAAIRSLEAQLVTLQKRISAFDELTGEKRQSKSTFDLADLVNDVLSSHSNEFRRHRIEMMKDTPSLRIKANRGMVIQILENLLSNSVYWLKQQEKYQGGFDPRIWVKIDPIEKTVTVDDNGPGIAPERKELIFQPFITSKPAAQGRGLGLYISRELAQHHDWQLYLDADVGLHRAGRLSRFVLDMGA